MDACVLLGGFQESIPDIAGTHPEVRGLSVLNAPLLEWGGDDFDGVASIIGQKCSSSKDGLLMRGGVVQGADGDFVFSASNDKVVEFALGNLIVVRDVENGRGLALGNIALVRHGVGGEGGGGEKGGGEKGGGDGEESEAKNKADGEGRR